MSASPMKQLSALVPVGMSVAALGMVLVHAALVGAGHEADEGTAPHVFQLLIAGQVPIIAYFALTWLPRSPRQALQVLATQAGTMLTAMAAAAFLT